MGKHAKKKKQVRGVQAPQARRGSGAVARVVEAGMAMAPVPLASAVDEARQGSEVRKVESTECQHVQSGINLGKLRRQFGRKVSPECHDCKPSTPVRVKGRARAMAAKKKTLWICLACGQIGCGSEIVGSPVAHATSHSKMWLHPVVMRLGEAMDCWCLQCNAQLEYVSEENGVKRATHPALLRGAAAVLRDSLFPKPDVEEAVPEVVVDSQPEVEPEGGPEVEARQGSEVRKVESTECKRVQTGIFYVEFCSLKSRFRYQVQNLKECLIHLTSTLCLTKHYQKRPISTMFIKV